MDSDIGECYADPEPLAGPQPYMHDPEAETVFVRVEDKHALSDGDGAGRSRPTRLAVIICLFKYSFYKHAINHL